MSLVTMEEEFEARSNGCPYDEVTLAHALKALQQKNGPLPKLKKKEEEKQEEGLEALLEGEACPANIPASQPSMQENQSSYQLRLAKALTEQPDLLGRNPTKRQKLQ